MRRVGVAIGEGGVESFIAYRWLNSLRAIAVGNLKILLRISG
jgi:hypothetical protein